MAKQPLNFWTFSTELYDLPGVADACLSLQNSYGLDVNLVLYCYWCGHVRGEFGPSQLQQALDFSERWKSAVVQPLRDARSWMKSSDPSPPGSMLDQWQNLRERIKMDELAAEKLQQDWLEDIAVKYGGGPAKPNPVQAAESNVSHYLSSTNTGRESGLDAALDTIQDAIARMGLS